MEGIFELVFPKTYFMIYRNVNGWYKIIDLMPIKLVKS